MVARNRISAVVGSTDLERSREFYEARVGLTLSPETVPNHLLSEAPDGTTLLVYGRPSPNLATTRRCASGAPTSPPTCASWLGAARSST